MSAPGRRNGSAERFRQGCLQLVVCSIRFCSFHRFACRAHGRHPFVPSGLAFVAQDIIHRPECPIRRETIKGPVAYTEQYGVNELVTISDSSGTLTSYNYLGGGVLLTKRG